MLFLCYFIIIIFFFMKIEFLGLVLNPSCSSNSPIYWPNILAIIMSINFSISIIGRDYNSGCNGCWLSEKYDC